MTLPNFMCVGAQKAGTTTLHDILRKHPDIYLPDVKETKFFVFDDEYEKGIKFYEREYFSKWRGQKAVGEIDPTYMFCDETPGRIHECLGSELKLIFILRHPVDRAYSQYWMNVRRGFETRPFEEAVESADPGPDRDQHDRVRMSYVSRGRYARQIKRFLKYFPKRSMLFFVFEDDFLRTRTRVVEKICAHLEIQNMPLEVDKQSNATTLPRYNAVRSFVYQTNAIRKIGKLFIPSARLRGRILNKIEEMNQVPFTPKKLDPAYKRLLMDKYFSEDIAEVEDIIGRDLRVWEAGAGAP